MTITTSTRETVAASMATPSPATLYPWRCPNATRRGSSADNASIPPPISSRICWIRGLMPNWTTAQATAATHEAAAPPAEIPRGPTRSATTEVATKPPMNTAGRTRPTRAPAIVLVGRTAEKAAGATTATGQQRCPQPERQEERRHQRTRRWRHRPGTRTAPLRNGLVRSSAAMDVAGPWPGYTTVSPGSAANRSSDRSRSDGLDIGRSVRPMEPMNRQSPPNTSPCPTNATWPGACPASRWSTSNANPPTRAARLPPRADGRLEAFARRARRMPQPGVIRRRRAARPAGEGGWGHSTSRRTPAMPPM